MATGGERIGEGFVEARLDTSRLNRDAEQMERTLQQRFDRVGRRMQQTGRTLTRRVTAPIVAMGTVIVRTAANFESSMNRVGALTQATGDDFDRLNERAQELGRTTQFSAAQAADGMAFLAQAGFETNEIYEAMPGILNLAAAGQLELAEASDIASNVLQGMNMDVSEMDRLVDVLAATSISANTDVRQLGDAMSFVAPVAAGLGVSVEEVAAAIGLMGDAGIQGGRAGTSLRMALSRLANETGPAADVLERLGVNALEADGSLRPLDEIIRDLEHSGANTSDMMQLFGERAGPAMATLVARGGDALKEFADDLQDAGGTAEEVAERQMEGLNGSLARMRSAMEGAAIAIGESGLLDMLASFAESVANLFQRLAETNPRLLNLIVVVSGLAAATGPALWAIGGMARGLAAMAPLLSGMVGLINPVTIAIVALADGVGQYNRSLADMRDETRETGRSFTEFVDSTSESELSWSILTDAVRDSVMPWRAAADRLAEARHGLELLTGSADRSREAQAKYTEELESGLTPMEESARKHMDAAQSARDLAQGLEDGTLSMDDARVAAAELGINIDDLEGDFSDLEDEVQSATQALSEFEAQQRAIADPIFNARRALNRFEDAQAAVNGLVEEGKQGTEEYNQALIDEFEAAQDAEFALRNLSAAHDDGVTSLEAIKGRADDLVESMGLSGEAADLARDLFVELFSAANDLPEVKEIDVNVTGNAFGALGDIVSQVGRLPGSVNIPVRTGSNIDTSIPQPHVVSHRGGWAGVGPVSSGPRRGDEVDTRLQLGEFVLSRDMLAGAAPIPPDLSGLLDGGPSARVGNLGGEIDAARTVNVTQTFQQPPTDVDLFRARDGIRHLADEVA